MPPIKQECGHLAGKSSLNNKLCTWFQRERCDFLSNLKNGWQTHTHIHSNLNKRFILIKLIIKWQWHAQRKQKLKIYTTLSERRSVWIPNEKSFMEFFHRNANTPHRIVTYWRIINNFWNKMNSDRAYERDKSMMMRVQEGKGG